MDKCVTLAVWVLAIPLAYADQGSFKNSGGSASGGGGVVVTASATTPPGTLSLNCPGNSVNTCAGGSLSFLSTDGTTAINASFTSGTFVEGCAGGGKGGHITCAYTLTGYFSGVLTVNGQSQAIIGVTYQAFDTPGGAPQGSTAYNSAYTPFYYSDSEQILRSDDLQGTNQITYGQGGGGVGQFYGAYGIALDAAGRIYVADTYNCRIVRIDDMNGTNWTTYGGDCGAGQGQFYDPSGIALDPSGRIYVLDTGNSRVVRIDNLSGANWAAFGTAGSGTGQFAPYIQSLAVDAAGRIYVADTGNHRVVRMDDITGANWTVLTQSPVVNGASYSLQNPAAVAVDAAGRIFIADNTSYQPAVIRVDDMTGANWTSVFTGANGGLNSIAVDAGGSVFAGGGGAKILPNLAAVLSSSGSIGPIGSYYVFGVTPVPLPSPRPPAIGFFPGTLNFSQNVGTASAPQAMTIANFGGSPLNLGPVSASGGFAESNNCPATLVAGANCTVNVTFTPAAQGDTTGSLSISDNSGNAGAAQSVVLTGTGTAPAALVTPGSLTFSSQVVGTNSAARNVTLQNTGDGPMTVASVTAAAPFSQTNNCLSGVAPGFSCTIQVTFAPSVVGAASGTLTIADNAGTQTVTLSANGSAPVSLSPTSLNFGTLAVGSTSDPRTVTLTNRLNVGLTISAVAASGPFALSGNTCGSGVAAGGSCTVAVTFTPTATGSASGALTFTDTAANSPQSVSLSGTGSLAVTLSSTSLSLGTVVVGSTSAAKTVTLSNHLSVPLNITGIAANSPFAVAGNTCGSSVAAGGNCTVGVTFAPTAAGNASGALTFTDSAGNSPQTVTLSGTGSAPVTLSASTINFGTQTVGSTSGTKSVTLTNRLSTGLSFTGITTSAPFAIASNTCGAGVAAGAACTVGVRFSPTANGPATGALTFVDTAANSPQVVTLTGTGGTFH